MTLIGADHEPTVTGGRAASVKLPQFKAVNTLLGNLKTALSGTYHAFDFVKYAHRYLAEAQYRFNRRFNLASILARLLHAACTTTPRPASDNASQTVCPHAVTGVTYAVAVGFLFPHHDPFKSSTRAFFRRLSVLRAVLAQVVEERT